MRRGTAWAWSTPTCVGVRHHATKRGDGRREVGRPDVGPAGLAASPRRPPENWRCARGAEHQA